MHSAARPSPDSPPIDVRELVVRCMGSAGIATLVLSKFEAQLRLDLPELGRRLAANDAIGVSRVAHALKGAAGAAAAHSVRDLAATIEDIAKLDQLPPVEGPLAMLNSEVDRCFAFMPVARRSLEQSNGAAS